VIPIIIYNVNCWLIILYRTGIDTAAAEPVCTTNITDAEYHVRESDSIAISCDIEFSGNLSPVLTCITDTPGQVAVDDRRQASSRLSTYQKVVAVSAELSNKQLSCTIALTDLANASLVEQRNHSTINFQRTGFNFNWTSPRVRVIHVGKIAVLVGTCTCHFGLSKNSDPKTHCFYSLFYSLCISYACLCS